MKICYCSYDLWNSDDRQCVDAHGTLQMSLETFGIPIHFHAGVLVEAQFSSKVRKSYFFIESVKI